MGMSYEIIPNKQAECLNDLSEELSFFFEQVGGYGQTAEVEQISKILKFVSFHRLCELCLVGRLCRFEPCGVASCL